MFPSRILLTFLVVVAVAAHGGCATEQESQPAASQQPTDAAVGAEQDEVYEALAELSPADRELAEEQQICLVSGESLGSMGTPIKVSVEGREVFVCCEACIDELKANFDKYKAKLDGES